MNLSKDQLVKACRNQGLDTSGDKAALADRLAVSESVEPAPEPEPELDPETDEEQPPPAKYEE